MCLYRPIFSSTDNKLLPQRTFGRGSEGLQFIPSFFDYGIALRILPFTGNGLDLDNLFLSIVGVAEVVGSTPTRSISFCCTITVLN